MKLTKAKLKQIIKEELEEGFMDALKQKVGLTPDNRSTLERIMDNPDIKGNFAFRGPLRDILAKASEEDLEKLLSALDQPLGASVR